MSSIPVTAAGGDPSVLPQVHALLPTLMFGKGQVSNQAGMLETHRGLCELCQNSPVTDLNTKEDKA